MSAPDANGWMPIESAPKDGTCVLLFGADRVSAGAWCEWDGTEDIEGGCCWSDWFGGFTDEYPATHWQPLPKPPVQTTPPRNAS